MTMRSFNMHWTRGMLAGMLVVLSFLSHPSDVEAVIGLSTRFVDVTLEYLQVGQVYNLRKLRNIPYTVRNRGDAAIRVRAVVSIPPKSEVADGYQPIPDPTWIQIIPNEFDIPPGQTAYAEIVVQIPNQPQYVGKHYQSKITAQTVNKGLFSAGTQSRLRFSTGPGPETLKQEAVNKAMMTMDFDVTPQEIYANNLEPGQTYNLNKLIQKKLKVSNRADTPIRMKFKSIPWVSNLILPEGYEPAKDTSWLTFSPEDAVIKGNRIVTVDPILKIPAGDELSGKKIAFLMKADLVMGVDLEIYTKVFVTIKSK